MVTYRSADLNQKTLALDDRMEVAKLMVREIPSCPKVSRVAFQQGELGPSTEKFVSNFCGRLKQFLGLTVKAKGPLEQSSWDFPGDKRHHNMVTHYLLQFKLPHKSQLFAFFTDHVTLKAEGLLQFRACWAEVSCLLRASRDQIEAGGHRIPPRLVPDLAVAPREFAALSLPD